METNYRFSIGDIVFSEFDYNGTNSFFPVKILEFAGVDRFGKNYLVIEQNGEKFNMYEDNLSTGEDLAVRTKVFIFNEDEDEDEEE